MTTAELLGKVAQRCYEITQEGEWRLMFTYYPLVDILDIYIYTNLGSFAGFIGAEKTTKENLINTLEKLENIEETYRELVE